MDANRNRDDLVRDLQALDWAQGAGALCAQIDAEGRLSPVGDLEPKLQAAKSQADLGQLHIIIVAEGQEDVPKHLLKDPYAWPLWVRKATTLREAVTTLRREIDRIGPLELLYVLGTQINKLFWAIRERRSPDPSPNVTALIRTCELLSQLREDREQTTDKELDIIDYIVRCSAFLQRERQPLEQEEIDRLVQYCEETWQLRFNDKLWAWERRALFLEMLEQFERAAELSEESAKRARREHRLTPFVAALHVRAAECFRQAGNNRRAVENFATAADLLAPEGRLSRKALEYYQAASDLAPEAPDHQRWEKAVKGLSDRLLGIEGKPRATVALVSNRPDADAADLLVHPLAEAEIACIFRDSAGVGDLADLHSCCDAIIVVGGIRAHQTDFLLHKHFYEEISVRQLDKEIPPVTFQSADIDGQRYCGVWYKKIADRPAYVLAGTVREETARAVLSFIGSTEFNELVERADDKLQSSSQQTAKLAGLNRTLMCRPS